MTVPELPSFEQPMETPRSDALPADVHETLPDGDVHMAEADTDPGASRTLAPAVQKLWRISLLLQAIVPSLVLGGVAWLVTRDHEALGARIGIIAGSALAPWLLAAFFAMRLPPRRYGAWRYQLGADALRLERGVMFRSESVVPYTRIQHVDTNQGPIERSLGLASVTVHTASGSSSSLTIPGLLPSDAEALREQLAQLAGMVEPL